MQKIISDVAINRRAYWIEEIHKLDGNFKIKSSSLQNKLELELEQNGVNTLVDHLRLCGSIPESYQQNSSKEKLYARYTEYLLANTFKSLGLTSIILEERSDVADVEVVAKSFSFVADAKVFRLSRTAKNQKDFKIQSMHEWKRGKPYAMIVCPIYQVPQKTSQIYHQASGSNVCILTYSHLALLLSFSELEGQLKAEELIYEIFKIIPSLMLSKDASSYWREINKTILNFSSRIENLWNIEKQAAMESITIAKEEALIFFTKERERIMHMNHEELLLELIRVHKIDSKIKVVQRVSNTKPFDLR